MAIPDQLRGQELSASDKHFQKLRDMRDAAEMLVSPEKSPQRHKYVARVGEGFLSSIFS
jgi:hypothetical protein